MVCPTERGQRFKILLNAQCCLSSHVVGSVHVLCMGCIEMGPSLIPIALIKTVIKSNLGGK